MSDDIKTNLREIPSVDEILKSPVCQDWLKSNPRTLVLKAIREVLNNRREAILKEGDINISSDNLFPEIEDTLKGLSGFSLRPLINATGIIIHTNLGRSLLGKDVIKNIEMIAGRYSNLEYDIEAGERGKRYSHLEEILETLTGAESSIAVNNNAAAVLLVLNTFARDKEVIVSRGELIEIGGSFRIPEVMDRSGAILREVGTTNKTHLRDYEGAINENTALLLKVHPSNYRVLGFTEEVSLNDMVILGQQRGVPVINDLGSGCFIDLKKYGICGEPNIQEVLKSGVDIVTFSGDKLLGGPQAGIILGKEVYIDRIRKNPLTRAVRIDKLTLAALEATLRLYLDEENAINKIPTLRMLTQPVKDIEKRAKKIEKKIKDINNPSIKVTVERHFSQAGGGSLPLINLPTAVVILTPSVLTVNKLEERLRKGERSVIARIKDDSLIFDARTIQDDEIGDLVNAISIAARD